MSYRLASARKPRLTHIAGRLYLALVLAPVVWAMTASGALGPAVGGSDDMVIAARANFVPAHKGLSYAGDGVEIAGAGRSLFAEEVFAGPNSALKVDRFDAVPDVISVASSFNEARAELMAARPKPEQSPRLRGIGQATGAPIGTVAPVDLTGVDPVLVSAALDAIEKASNNPAPEAIPQQLAYARADRPATVFKRRPSEELDPKQLTCLETAIYFEARGESYRGQIGVAQVVLNRVKHRLYPNTICGVVYQNQSRRNACQFSFACDGIPERVTEAKAWAQAQEIATKVVDGDLYLPEVANATHYHANYVHPRWAPRMDRVTKIGLHIFYRFMADRPRAS